MVDDDTWSGALHRLWQAASRAEEVAALADDVYAPLLATPGVHLVVGTRWDEDATLRYMRALGADGDAPVIIATTRSMPGAAVREPDGEPVVTRSPVGELDDAAWPEAEFLRQSPGASVVACTFRLDRRGWAGLSVAVDASADTEGVARRVAQAVDVIVACHTGILQRGREARRGADDALLAEASLQMDSSLDVEDTLRRVARIAVPAVADGCLVHLLRKDGPEFVAATHVAVQQQRALEEAGRDDPWLAALLAQRDDGDQALFLSGAALDGSPFAGGGRHPTVVSVSTLHARGRVVGSITFVYQRPEDRLPDSAFLDSLATRAALAIDNALLYELRRHAVLSLQEHLLPSQLPAVKGWDLSASYEVGDPMLDVGGDFYDAVPRPDGCFGDGGRGAGGRPPARGGRGHRAEPPQPGPAPGGGDPLPHRGRRDDDDGTHHVRAGAGARE
ncbi:hypothetical protein R1Y80_20790 [Streptomyces sp. JL1001]|uniref:GAF domain-containing protein n=1 Tax=Streptomyces sp. JL1001 TaxID=3078227 RepID=A0AAU8KLJ1_9ACTN